MRDAVRSWAQAEDAVRQASSSFITSYRTLTVVPLSLITYSCAAERTTRTSLSNTLAHCSCAKARRLSPVVQLGPATKYEITPYTPIDASPSAAAAKTVSRNRLNAVARSNRLGPARASGHRNRRRPTNGRQLLPERWRERNGIARRQRCLEGTKGAYAIALAFVSTAEEYHHQITDALMEFHLFAFEFDEIERFGDRSARMVLDDHLCALAERLDDRAGSGSMNSTLSQISMASRILFCSIAEIARSCMPPPTKAEIERRLLRDFSRR
jgi:hypothetical protein